MNTISSFGWTTARYLRTVQRFAFPLSPRFAHAQTSYRRAGHWINRASRGSARHLVKWALAVDWGHAWTYRV